MNQRLVIVLVLLIFGGVARAEEKTYADWSKFDPSNFDPAHTVTFEVGDLRVVIGARRILPIPSVTAGLKAERVQRRLIRDRVAPPSSRVPDQ